MSIRAQLETVKQDIATAAVKSGRKKEEICLIAVSKTYPISAIEAAVLAGQMDFGENRPQEMAEKHAILPHLRWHLIGQLQRNKVKSIVSFVYMIHSVDSLKLLETIEKEAAKIHRNVKCLLQINISDEGQKSGMTEAEAIEILQKPSEFAHISFCGLMGIAAFTSDTAIIEAQFQRLRDFQQQVHTQFPALAGDFEVLSMGMSGDYPIAIEKGATHVRIGTAIFGAR